MGAWIEIKKSGNKSREGGTSHSIWVRGLKYLMSPAILAKSKVALYMGAWIEILDT